MADQAAMLSDAALDELGIPEPNREFFRDRVAHLVAQQHRGFEPWYFLAGEVARPLEHIAKLASELESALSAAADENGGKVACAVHARLDHAIRRVCWPDGEKIDYVESCRKQSEMLRDAAMRAAEEVRSTLDEQGAPPGIRGYPGLREFIGLLAVNAFKVGGSVKVDKRNGAGSLITLLEALRNDLPDNFMPPEEEHPTSSYARRIEEARADWESLGKPIRGQK